MTKPKSGRQRGGPKADDQHAERAADVNAETEEEGARAPHPSLTLKQTLFVAEYLVDFNASGAALRAGYSAKTAYAIGHENLKNPEIKAAIADAIERRKARLNVEQDEVVRELHNMAFFDPLRIAAQEIKRPEDIARLPEDVRRAIVGWSWDKAGNFTLKLSSKIPALQLLGQHLGMFKQEIDVNLKGAIASALEKARRRVASHAPSDQPDTRH